MLVLDTTTCWNNEYKLRLESIINIRLKHKLGLGSQNILQIESMFGLGSSSKSQCVIHSESDPRVDLHQFFYFAD